MIRKSERVIDEELTFTTALLAEPQTWRSINQPAQTPSCVASARGTELPPRSDRTRIRAARVWASSGGTCEFKLGPRPMHDLMLVGKTYFGQSYLLLRSAQYSAKPASACSSGVLPNCGRGSPPRRFPRPAPVFERRNIVFLCVVTCGGNGRRRQHYTPQWRALTWRIATITEAYWASLRIHSSVENVQPSNYCAEGFEKHLYLNVLLGCIVSERVCVWMLFFFCSIHSFSDFMYDGF